MNREIKFRAWDRKERKMIYDALLIGNIGLGDGSVVADVEAKKGNELDWMQYTGLKDKNGKDIYEGDIVTDTMDDKNITREIRWYRGGFMQHKNGYFGFSNIETYDGDCEHLKVIGNIYENPELIK